MSKAIDTAAAEAYERLLVPTLMLRLAEEAVARAGLRPGERVLDVACGTGIVVRLAASRVAPGGSLTGVDLDAAMIAVAGTLAQPTSDVTIDWRCASAQELPFDTAAFDAVFCLQGLQYFPDPATAMAEMRRVMKPDGRLLAVVWTRIEDCKGQLALAQALERRGIDAASVRKAYSFGDPVRVRALASGAGFRDVDIRAGSTTARFPSAGDFIDAFAAGSMSSRAAIARVPESGRGGFLREIAADLKPYADENGVAFPLGYLMMTAGMNSQAAR